MGEAATITKTMNVYEPLDATGLKAVISQVAPLYIAGGQSGFEVRIAKENHATVIWRNVGEDEYLHRDELEKLRNPLCKAGYEIKMLKPANTTMVVRKVQPVVIHGSAIEGQNMGPFESQVESQFSGAMIRIPAGIRNQMNGDIADLVRPIQSQIPLKSIDDILRRRGYLLVQEDGTTWSGFLTGRDGNARIEIGVVGTADDYDVHTIIDNAMLILSWHKFDTGRYEVVAYIS